jgi:hypothetical protein
LLQYGSIICCIPPSQEKQHGHEQDSFKRQWRDNCFHYMWQTSEYSSQLYITLFIVKIYLYDQTRLNAECACPHAEFTGNQRKQLISHTFMGIWGNVMGLCVSHKCTCHNWEFLLGHGLHWVKCLNSRFCLATCHSMHTSCQPHWLTSLGPTQWGQQMRMQSVERYTFSLVGMYTFDKDSFSADVLKNCGM